MLTPLPEKDWTRAHAVHVLNRAGFGGSPATIEDFTRLGVFQAVDALVNASDTPERFPAPAWATARNTLAQRREALRKANGDEGAMQAHIQKFRREQRLWLAELQNWWLQLMLKGPSPFLEKMTLFWHGHFATSARKARQAYLLWLQNETLRSAALGHFGDLLKAVSRDPAMIEWLDLHRSRARNPNENFARKLLELFTLGEGNYTEEDVKQRAEAFTGYKNQFTKSIVPLCCQRP